MQAGELSKQVLVEENAGARGLCADLGAWCRLIGKRSRYLFCFNREIKRFSLKYSAQRNPRPMIGLLVPTRQT